MQIQRNKTTYKRVALALAVWMGSLLAALTGGACGSCFVLWLGPVCGVDSPMSYTFRICARQNRCCGVASIDRSEVCQAGWFGRVLSEVCQAFLHFYISTALYFYIATFLHF